MRWRNTFLIFQREVLDQLRDRRTLFMVAVLPILLYPLLGIGLVQMTLSFAEQPRTVVILGAADLPPEPLLEGSRFAPHWFHSPGEADKLRVVTDLPSTDQVPPVPLAQRQADDDVLQLAREMRDLVSERQKTDAQVRKSREDNNLTETAELEKSIQSSNARLTALFDKSHIQVLILIPTNFAKNLELRQKELSNREAKSQPHVDYPRPIILQNSADDKSVIAHRRVHDVLQEWERVILKKQLQESQLPESLTEPVMPAELDVAEQEHVSANVWARMIPALLVIMALTGAFYPAVDLCAGEKERGTMETLLICPATRTEIVLGKFLTVFVFSATTAILNLVSVGMTSRYITSLAMAGAPSRIGEISLPPLSALIWVALILLPLATLFSALCLAIATFARSTKEGQYYLTPLLMVTLGLTIFCLSPGTEMQPFYSVLPVIGPGLLLKGMLKASGPNLDVYLYAIPVFVTSVGYSLLALWWSIEQFGSEEVLFREAERFDLRLWIKHLLRDKEPTPTFSEAAFCFLLILILQFSSWRSFQDAIKSTPSSDQGLFHIRLLIVQQLALIATPALMMGLILTTNLRRTFSMRWPGFFRMTCAGLLAVTLHPLTVELITSLQWFFPPLPPKMAELMMQLKTADIRLVILAFAVTPAICEEIAFRGFLLSGFRRHGRLKTAIVLSSFAFGIIHMIPHQVFNATLLGLVLGAICVQNRSIFPGIFFHFVYNSLGVLHDRIGKLIPVTGSWTYFFRMDEGSLQYQPLLLVLLAVAAIALLYATLRPPSIKDSDEAVHDTPEIA